MSLPDSSYNNFPDIFIFGFFLWLLIVSSPLLIDNNSGLILIQFAESIVNGAFSEIGLANFKFHIEILQNFKNRAFTGNIIYYFT